MPLNQVERPALAMAGAATLFVLLAAALFLARDLTADNAHAEPQPFLGDTPPGFSNTPRRPTTEECDNIRELLPGALLSVRKILDQQPGADEAQRNESQRRLDASAQRSAQWIERGCPADPVLGMYDHLSDPRVVGMRFLDWPPPGETWTGTDQ